MVASYPTFAPQKLVWRQAVGRKVNAWSFRSVMLQRDCANRRIGNTPPRQRV